MPTTTAQSTVCSYCQADFASRNAFFRHMKESVCLNETEKVAYQALLSQREREKVVLLYGYVCSDKSIQNGTAAVQELMKVLQNMYNLPEDLKYSRAFGNECRKLPALAQDEGTGAISEAISVRLPPVLESMDDWRLQVNAKLPFHCRLLARQAVQHEGFNAELVAGLRRAEYLVPADFYFPNNDLAENRHDFFALLPTLLEGVQPHRTHEHDALQRDRVVLYLYKLKKYMQSMTTKSKASCLETMQILRGSNNSNNDNTTSTPLLQEPKSVVKRRYYHNFTPRLMAHEELCHRQLDRFYHRATVHDDSGRAYIVLSLRGDTLLQGQVRRLVTLAIALAQGVVEPALVDCVLDGRFVDLVPIPPMPYTGMVTAEASFAAWEGKTQRILTPRVTKRFAQGWNDVETVERIAEWRDHVRQCQIQAWNQQGVQEDGRLTAEKIWTETVLYPWAQQASRHLDEYRSWKAGNYLPTIRTDTILDCTTPPLFATVLECLRQVDQSGQWPSTTPKRQLVMSSQAIEGQEPEIRLPQSLGEAQARSKAKTEVRYSPYIFQEGQGGASGSFSIGAMPYDQPKANEQFPELLRAAFALEILLRPHREPSSTIAINRNAQFRPHTDSGAGAGQSTSLIVGLGNYKGGELVVEGERRSIRYQALEFDGWKQRHWTLPFEGERFSLVWFTPRGCEGKHGIDLCK